MNMILKQAALILSAQASSITSREEIRARVINVDQKEKDAQENALKYLEGELPFARSDIAKKSISDAIEEVKRLLEEGGKAIKAEVVFVPYSSPGSEEGKPED